jgi:hypothetical protein
MWRRRYPAVVGAIAFLFADVVHAGGHPVVVVLESSDGVPTGELVSELRVHLGGVADVRSRPSLPTGVLADRFARAASVVEDGSAILVVWIERTVHVDAHDDYIVYAVGRDPSRALVEVVRIAADGRAGTVRIMALKVASLVDEILSAAGSSGDTVRSFAHASVSRRQLPGSYVLQVGGGVVGSALGGDAGAQGGISFAAGIERPGRELDLSVHAGVCWLSGMYAEHERGEIDIAEIDLAIGLHATKRWRGHGLGIQVQVGARLLDADAVAFDGRTDSAFSLVPVAGAGLHGEVRPWRRMGLRFHVGMETAAFRQRFLLLHRPAVDVGRFRTVSGLSLVWAWR